MSTFDYAGLKQTATGLIIKFGRDVTLRHIVKSGSPYDPTLTPTDSTIKAAVVPFNQNDVDGTQILMSDKKFIFTSDIEITHDMKLVDGGKEYSIVTNNPINPGDVNVVNLVQARA